MTRSQTFLSYLFLTIGFVATAVADNSEAPPPEGPYFQVASADPTVDRLPLKSTDAQVRIAGVTADVTITQHYRNEGSRAIEARYVFPGRRRPPSTGCASSSATARSRRASRRSSRRAWSTGKRRRRAARPRCSSRIVPTCSR